MASIKRQLAARVAEGLGLDARRTDRVLRAFYEEMLRASNEELRGKSGILMMRGVGRFSASPSRRGHDRGVGAATRAHWAFFFKPYRAMIRRCAEVCSALREQG